MLSNLHSHNKVNTPMKTAANHLGSISKNSPSEAGHIAIAKNSLSLKVQSVGAWAPHSALHPTIGVHSPLVFDVVDTWNSRSIGGCSYHIAHRGGLSYDILPVNAYEAEARRVSRFWDINHSPGKFRPPPTTDTTGQFIPRVKESAPITAPIEEINEAFPYTLDLRRQPSRI